MNALLRGLRVIDDLEGVDDDGWDVRLEGGRITALGPGLAAGDLPELELPGCILTPGLVDLHAHLREPGDEEAETVASGAAAAAAGGFTQIVAMANTDPPVDSPERVARAVARNAGHGVRILQVAALTRGLEGAELVDIPGCAAAGAVAFSDDGRNLAPPELLARGLSEAARVGRPVLVHPEDEGMIAASTSGRGSPARRARRPPEAEVSAVEAAIEALRGARAARLHLQHLSTSVSVARLRAAREEGLQVTAEVTPHHLAMAAPREPAAHHRVNPPLRGDGDRRALLAALATGVIDAVATDHAPHRAAAKADGHDAAAPGMIGLETALPTCLGMGGDDATWLPRLVRALSTGPLRVLGGTGRLEEPRLRRGAPATCAVIDPASEWEVSPASLRSRSANTPLLGARLRGRVLLTMVAGRVLHLDAERLPSLRAAVHA